MGNGIRQSYMTHELEQEIFSSITESDKKMRDAIRSISNDIPATILNLMETVDELKSTIKSLQETIDKQNSRIIELSSGRHDCCDKCQNFKEWAKPKKLTDEERCQIEREEWDRYYAGKRADREFEEHLKQW